ncbi:cleavage stimulation factor subunit 2-like isoform X1 [Salvelinus fontinalis]|uniref:cleavage stimulation factor subunit 2-like isoform X1 n=1 Tax=Salvelinus fontinalis TaxID=8038 RepID=UPI0024859114|nr:cleavage stimulation factor subunit 2-like isoform X1 [Salvelinus fontinalis]XP_055744669.1 cleavage stimulation factor subunit 2-like isoform X1 [Salvelinus fontinalis]XP_055744670.1 cleavage stimulation factor subunit 2-like isoform X1 [Salvelinus fontinalis]XP_055744671.1 cleavage stimulation factor subunit 2-like isoform X1 [Salvelinus fontinalis]
MATLAAAAVVAAAGRDPAVDRSLRSVFVGNIPYEATEEQLKDIFSEVGLVVSFRLVYDRETGKPKGYGFCEYQDQETALSAMRNLNGREFSGRALRVDNAASEKNKEELKSLGTGAPIIESPYGDNIMPDEAPESISRAVASLPPEQMFELMKQMKLCVQNSPQEARNMLLQNPQLAFALLQAQVVMRIVDPEIALKMLHRQTPVQPLVPNSQAGPVPVANQPIPPANAPVSQSQPMPGMHMNGAPQMMQPPPMGGGPGPMPGQGPVGPPGNLQHSPVGSSGQAAIERPQGPGGIPPRGLLGDGPNDPRGGTLLSVTGEVIEPSRGGGFIGAPPPHQGPPMHMNQMAGGPPLDMRPPHDMRGPPMGEPRGMMGEPRGPPMGEPRGMMGEPRGPPMGEPRGMMGEPRGPPMGEPRGMMGEPRGPPMGEPRGMMGEPRGPPMGEPRGMMGEPRGPPMMEQRGPPMMEPRGPPMENRGRDPRAVDPRGPVSGQRVPTAQGMQGPPPHTMNTNAPPPARPGPGVPQSGGSFSPGQSQVTSQDHEKAALIMQVLQLTPEQIAMLPPEQRQSILVLKEQILKTTGAP